MKAGRHFKDSALNNASISETGMSYVGPQDYSGLVLASVLHTESLWS